MASDIYGVLKFEVGLAALELLGENSKEADERLGGIINLLVQHRNGDCVLLRDVDTALKVRRLQLIWEFRKINGVKEAAPVPCFMPRRKRKAVAVAV